MTRAGSLALLFAVALASAAAQSPKKDDKALKPPANRNVKYGMPSPAKADAEKSATDFLIDRPQYVMSYNEKKHSANWVSWHLTKTDIGNTARGAFEEDADLPAAFKKVQHGTYSGSGFDRGHMCPSKDRSKTEKDNDAVFLMTNMLPQSPACNQKGWERLESYCRDLATGGAELYIACGGHGLGGTTEDGVKKLNIGRAGLFVTVPSQVWKVILVVPNKIVAPDAKARTIAVWVPNDATVTDDWPKYRVSVAEVEKHTGYTFWPLLPEDVSKAIKEKPDAVKVVVPPR